jgi:hypothetical protein
MATLRREKVVDQWFALVEGGAGKDRAVLDKTEQAIKEFAAPGVLWQREIVSTGMLGEKREFLMVVHEKLREYAMFIGARDFGRDLNVSWFLTVYPGFLKRAISKRLTRGDPNALSMEIDVFAQQDLAAYKQVVHNCLQETLKTLMDDLKQDYSTIDRKSKGFLSVW